MKKILILGLAMSSIVLAEEFNMDTEIKGEIKKKYEISREIIDDVTEVAPESTKIKNIETLNKINVENVEGEIEKIELQVDDELNLDLDIDEAIGEIDALIEEADSDNYFKFGAGGYNSLDSFNYGIRYSNEIKEYDLDYKINIDRNIRGEDKAHSDISTDLFSAEVNYGQYQLALEHQIKDQEYLGGGDRKLSETEINVKYEVKSTPKNSVSAGVDIYRAGSESAQSRRGYENMYLHLYGEYDEIIAQDKMSHILETKGGYYVDNMESTGTSVLYVEAFDKLRHDDYKNYELDLTAGLEVVNKDVEDNNIGLNAGLKAVKKIDEKTNLTAFVEREQKNSTTREVMNGLTYVNDILMFKNSSNAETELKPEDNFILGASVDYTEESLFGEIAVKLISSKNKIAYSQVGFGTEKAVEAANYNKDLSWTELEAKAAYSKNEFRGEIKAKYSTLEELAYIPKYTTTLSGIYDKAKVRVQADMNIYSNMYIETAGTTDRYEVEGYTSMDVTYLYRFTSLMEGSVVISNLLNAEKEVLEDYKVDERKITFECKVRY